MKKRIITLILTIILTLSIIKPAATAQRLDFVDIGDHWVRPFLECLHREGADVFSGIYENGNVYFRPNMPMTRAMFATTLVRLFELYDDTAENPFIDVCDNAWYASFVASAAAADMIHGVNPEGTLFAPEALLTRQEAFVMVANICLALPYFDEIDETEWAGILGNFPDADDVSNWAMRGTAFSIYHRLVQGSLGRLRPANQITRAEAAALILNLFDRIRVARVWHTPPPPVTLRLAPHMVSVDDRELEATVAVTGIAEGEITFERGNLPDAITLSADGDTIIVTGVQPETGFIVGTYPVTVTRDGYEETLFVRVNLSPPPPPPNPPPPPPPIPPVTDKTALYQAYRDSDYFFDVWYMFTPESLEDVRTWVRNAFRVINNQWAGQDEIDATYDALIYAKSNLVPLPKEEFLLRLIRLAEVNEQLAHRFTPDSMAAMLIELDIARELHESGGTFDEYYDTAFALWEANRTLVLTYRYQIPSFLTHARIYVNNSRYTQESRDVLRAAIDRTVAALDDPDVTDAYLGEVLDALRQAILGLHRVGWVAPGAAAGSLRIYDDFDGCTVGRILCPQLFGVLNTYLQVSCVIWM